MFTGLLGKGLWTFTIVLEFRRCQNHLNYRNCAIPIQKSLGISKVMVHFDFQELHSSQLE